MSDNDDEPFDHSPRDEDLDSEIGEFLPAPLATAELRVEMTTIWELATIVNPQKGSWSLNLKGYWGDFMARFRHYEAK